MWQCPKSLCNIATLTFGKHVFKNWLRLSLSALWIILFSGLDDLVYSMFCCHLCVTDKEVENRHQGWGIRQGWSLASFSSPPPSFLTPQDTEHTWWWSFEKIYQSTSRSSSPENKIIHVFKSFLFPLSLGLQYNSGDKKLLKEHVPIINVIYCITHCLMMMGKHKIWIKKGILLKMKGEGVCGEVEDTLKIWDILPHRSLHQLKEE